MAFQNQIVLSLLLLLQMTGVVRPEDTNTNVYRLTGNLIPSKYDIDLTLEEDFGVTGRFYGTVIITFEAKDAVSDIVLHSNNLTFSTGNIQISPTTPGTSFSVQSHSFNTTREMVTITTDKLLEANKNYTISISNYEGFLDFDMYGFYRSTYNNALGDREWIAVTQFEATYARRAFPCFDEPQYKATFDIHINHPLDYRALSNAEIKEVEVLPGNKKTNFKTTPTMPTYLLAFAVTKFSEMSMQVDGIKHSIWSSIETIAGAQYGLSLSPQLLRVIGNFTQIPYSIANIPKLDQVSIADFAAGAMENWGLVTYRESNILWNPHESSARNKQRIGSVIAHELSHMWFGNLATTKWWSATWLNEGFADFFEYLSLAQIETDWELEKQFIIEEHQFILTSDALDKAKPLTNPNVSSSSDVSAMFSKTTYKKGASVIRMMYLFLGEAAFFNGIHSYLDTFKFNSTVPLDLFTKLQENADKPLPDTLPTIMTSWTEKPGFPLITVSRSDNELILNQTQFFSNSTSTTKWYIPVVYTTSVDKDFNRALPRIWMLPNESQTVINNAWSAQTKWVIFNIQASAYARVNYDDELWNGIMDALHKENSDGITPIHRAQIVDDAMNLARADIISYEKGLNIISFLRHETDYYPWYSAFNALAYLTRRISRESQLAQLLGKYTQRQMQTLYNNVSFANNNLRHVDMHKKVLALNWGCQLGIATCISQAQELFNNYKNNNVTVNPNLRGLVYCTALRHSNQKENWEYLWRKLENRPPAAEVATLISALGCTKNEELLMRYLNESIKQNSVIRRQDGQTVFSSVISGNSEGVAIGLKFLNSSFKYILLRYGGLNALTSVISGLADRLTTSDQIAQLEAFIATNREELKDAATSADAAIENAKKNLAWVVANEEELLQYLKSKDEGTVGGGASSARMYSSVLAVVVVILWQNWC